MIFFVYIDENTECHLTECVSSIHYVIYVVRWKWVRVTVTMVCLLWCTDGPVDCYHGHTVYIWYN